MEIISILTLIILIFILIAIGLYFYREYIQTKTSNKISLELEKTLKKNIKKKALSDDLIPEDWLKNENVSKLDGFLDNTIETNFNGKDLNSFLKGLLKTDNSMLMSLFSNMLSGDSETLTKLSAKLGLSPNLAKPILIMALTGVGKVANSVLVNMLSSKLGDKLPGKIPKQISERRSKKKAKRKMIEINEVPSQLRINF